MTGDLLKRGKHHLEKKAAQARVFAVRLGLIPPMILRSNDRQYTQRHEIISCNSININYGLLCMFSARTDQPTH